MPSSSPGAPVDAGAPVDRADLRKKLVWLTVFRTVATTLLMGVIAVRQLSTLHDPLTVEDQASYVVIGAVYLLTLIYALVLRQGAVAKAHGYVQILGDVILATALVYLTGGAESPFTFTYSLAVVAGSILLFGAGAFFAAVASASAFVALLLLLEAGWLPGGASLPTSRLLFSIASNVLAQFLIAALASYLGKLLSTAGGKLIAREEDLQKLATLQRQILASMPSGLMTCSAEGRLTFVNRAGAAILEVEERDSGDLAAIVPGLDWRSVDGRRRELDVPTRSGTKVLGFTLTALETPPGSALIVFQDLTNLRRVEAELRHADQLAALGRMAAQLAHEIRNPLASMRGSAQMLAEDVKDPAQARLSRILIREADRLASLVDAFLKFARPPDPAKQSLALDALIQETADMLRTDPKAQARPLELELRPVRAFADPDQVRQVVLNLLRNAFEALDGSGEGKVRVSVGGGEGVSSFTVWDSAGTIPPANLPRLFEPFFTTRSGGTGLGLAVSHAIVQAHGGTIRVQSSREAGTEFTVTLPAAPEVPVADPGSR